MAKQLKYFTIAGALVLACFLMVRLGEKVFAPPIEQGQTHAVAYVVDQKGSGRPLIGGTFNLTDQEGQSRTDADFKGKYMLVYFGYTFCPDICPTALYTISQALEKLGNKKVENNIVPLFISIDPERDTVDQLALYKTNFDPHFVMLTGTKDQVDQAVKAYRAYYTKATPDGTSSDYLMDHSSIIYVMDRQGRYVTSFNHETPAKDIARALSNLL